MFVSSFIATQYGIDTVVCTGVLTDPCVSSTVRSLADESFKVLLLEALKKC